MDLQRGDCVKLLLISLLLIPVIASATDNKQQITALEAAITQQQQEQKILFQQFQMLQELRQYEIAQDNQSVPIDNGRGLSGAAPKYEDIQKQREERVERIRRYTHELNELYQHYQEAKNKRRILIEQLNELKLDEAVSVK